MAASRHCLGFKTLILWHTTIVAAVSLAERNTTAGHLVVHMGPHKTGTSTLQNFLITEQKFISETLRVHVGAEGGAKHGAIIANTMEKQANSAGEFNPQYVNPLECERLLEQIRGWLLAGGTVVLSAERFDSVSVEVLLRLAGLGASETTFVHVHRATANWLRSGWMQGVKNSRNPTSFLQYLVQPLSLEYQGSLFDRLDEAQRRSGERVNVVGIAYEGTNMVSFVLCEAALRLAGDSLSECRAQLASRPQVNMLKNISPPPANVDVVRLARHAAVLLKCNLPIVTASSKLVFEVAEQLPLTCSDTRRASEAGTPTPKCAETALVEFQRASDRSWYERTGVTPPEVDVCPEVCLVDETRLTDAHWKTIRELLQGCRA